MPILPATMMPVMGPAILLPRAAVSNVILTATNQFCMMSRRPDFYPRQGNLQLNTIAGALRASGFDRVSVVESASDNVADLEEDRKNVVDYFERLGAREKGAIIGVSTTTSEIYKYRELAGILTSEFPDAQIIAGGAHFIRQRIDGHMDPVEHLLRSGLAHAVQVGDAQGFVDLIVKHGGRREDVESPGFYQLDHGSDQLIGRGVGRYPRADSIPCDVTKGKATLTTQFGRTCNNGCDFCAVPRRPRPFFSADEVVDGMSKILANRRPTHLRLCDPNPLAADTIGYYREIFGALDKRHPTVKDVYLDPAALAVEENWESTAVFLLRGMFWFHFAGRDAVTEEDAAVIGTRYLGRVKDQKMLDGEREALFRLIRTLKGLHKHRGAPIPFGLTLSYIITPMENRDTAQAKYDDIMSFLSHSDDLVGVDIEISPLMPYPGTKIRKKYAAVIDMEEFDFGRDTGDSISPWKKDAGSGVKFLRRALLLDRRYGSKVMMEEFRKAVDESF